MSFLTFFFNKIIFYVFHINILNDFNIFRNVELIEQKKEMFLVTMQHGIIENEI